MHLRTIGILVNAVLRAGTLGVILHALRNPDARRYAGKAIGTRGLTIVPASLLVPAVHALRQGRGEYPVWTDNLYLSIFALDMGGNVLDLYDRYHHFDLGPHFHGTGAATVVAAELARAPAWGAIGMAQTAHVLLEAQEYYSDVAFGLRNVRGTWDTVNDLLAGLAGSMVYAGAWVALRRGARWISR